MPTSGRADRDEAFVRALRGELGPDRKIMIDIGATIHWDVRTAVQRARMFEKYDVDSLEEPLGADDPDGYQQLRVKTGLRLGYGEREWTPRGIQRIAGTGTVDVVGVDPGRCESITGWLAARRHIDDANAEINAHAWSSAIVTTASLALSMSASNCRQIEIKPLPNPMQDELIAQPVMPIDGRLHPRDGDGLGIEVRGEVVDRYRVTR